MEISFDELKIRFPSGEKTTDITCEVCPVNVFKIKPDETSHNFIDLSADPLEISFPSGEKATEYTASR
jgi:hypothetical protein